MFTVALIFPALVFGPWLGYLDLYAKESDPFTDDSSSCWKYYSLNIALSDFVSAIVMLSSLRNFNIASKQQIISTNTRKNKCSIACFTLYAITEVFINVSSLMFWLGCLLPHPL